jgi:hypothetical protein
LETGKQENGQLPLLFEVLGHQGSVGNPLAAVLLEERAGMAEAVRVADSALMKIVSEKARNGRLL